MKKCLLRNLRERVTIPERPEQEWLGIKEGTLPSPLPSPSACMLTVGGTFIVGFGEAEPEPAKLEEETIINLRQFLQDGTRLEQMRSSAGLCLENFKLLRTPLAPIFDIARP